MSTKKTILQKPLFDENVHSFLNNKESKFARSEIVVNLLYLDVER